MASVKCAENVWHVWMVWTLLIATHKLSNVDLCLRAYQLDWCSSSHWDGEKRWAIKTDNKDICCPWLQRRREGKWLAWSRTEGVTCDIRLHLERSSQTRVVAAVKVRQAERRQPIQVFHQCRDSWLTWHHLILAWCSVYEVVLSPHLLRNTSLQAHQPTPHLFSPWSLSKSERSATDLCVSQQPESDSSALEIESSKKHPRHFWTIFCVEQEKHHVESVWVLQPHTSGWISLLSCSLQVCHHCYLVSSSAPC